MDNPFGVRFVSEEEFREIAGDGQQDIPVDIALHKGYVTDVIKTANSDASRQIQFAVSTEAVDRERDIIKASGWKLASYKKNPTVLFAHDYRSLPIAKAVKIGAEAGKLISTAEFATAEQYPFAETVFQMIHGGFLNAASVGFRPMKVSFDEERRGYDILQAELLEWSVVPVPANAEALVQWSIENSGAPQVRAYREWCERYLDAFYGGKGMWLPRERVEQALKALAGEKTTVIIPGGMTVADPEEEIITQRAVPANVSTEMAPEGTAWSAPKLADFTDKPWGDLTNAEKRRIAGHFAYSRVLPPETFGDLKLPHHRTSDGKAVWRGVAAAMSALMGGRGGVDAEGKKAIHGHLAAHYRAFGKEPPEFREIDCEDCLTAIAEGGLKCEKDHQEPAQEQARAADPAGDPVLILDEPDMEVVLILEEKEDDGVMRFVIDEKELVETVSASFGKHLSAAVTDVVRSEINYMRGRLD